MRQLAWLNATPEAPQTSGKQAKQPSRLRRFQDAGADLPLPPLIHAERLLGMLFEVGMATSGGMGPAPITWAEIGQWQRLTAQTLQPWEAKALRQASVAYVSELSKAADPACPAPWAAEPTEDDRKRIADGLREALLSRRKG